MVITVHSQIETKKNNPPYITTVLTQEKLYNLIILDQLFQIEYDVETAVKILTNNMQEAT